MRPIHIPVLLLGTALTLACSDRAPQPLAAGPGPAFDFTNGPASPGSSGIVRVGDGFFVVVTVDESAELVSVHGFEPSLANRCATGSGRDETPIQRHEVAEGAVVGLVLDREKPVEIFPLELLTGGLCASFGSATPLYRGIATLRRTDNNLTPTGTEGGRANAFGWSAQGVLDATAGGKVRYSEEVLLLINPQTDEFTEVVSKIRVRPM